MFKKVIRGTFQHIKKSVGLKAIQTQKHLVFLVQRGVLTPSNEKQGPKDMILTNHGHRYTH